MSTPKIDRAALIEASANAIEASVRRFPIPQSGAFQGSLGWGATPEDLGSASLDAILPLIADAIEAEARGKRGRAWQASDDLGPTIARQMHAEVDGAILAARLVRSLGGAS